MADTRLQWIQRRLNSRVVSAVDETGPQDDHASSPPAFRHLHRIEPTSEIFSDFTRDEYIAAVGRVIEYIRAGDIFQANLSQRLMAPWRGTAAQLYSHVRRQNPAPFCGLLKTDEFSIVSASPERFLKVDRNRHVETRPIKGTRRRPRSPIADLYAGTELATSEKDRAENVMIVDLLRNDISRSCHAGSVRVTGLCEIERFETVLHLVSTVVGTLRDDRDVWDLMAGCFPGGSITGAPKIRAMQIIAELEPTVRGAYCGSLFILGPCGDFDSSILIRTFTLKDGWVQFPVGGGIVADSDPLDEYRETLHKASGMIRSLRGS
jgi:para-aminobenzoate synthetase component 1